MSQSNQSAKTPPSEDDQQPDDVSKNLVHKSINQSPSQHEAVLDKSKAITEQAPSYTLRDLLAQETMAEAAIWMAAAAVLTLFITSMGTLLIWRQVKLTRQAVEDTSDATVAMREANVIAERNAEAARRAAMTASEANQLAREAMQRQLRPYVHIGKPIITHHHMASVDHISDYADVAILCRNYGQTPAHDVKLAVNCFIGGIWNEPFEGDFTDATIIYLGSIPPGDEKQRTGYVVHGIKKAHPFILDSTQSIFVDGVINYVDDFGQTHATRFRYASTGTEYENSEWSETPEGNVAT